MSDLIHHRLAPLLAQQPLRAGQFIVTIYGDIVAPRDAALWIGDLIAICAPLGISETLVRTAMSRLVAAGQMEGTRQGRRSYYHLTRASRAEFQKAAQQIYAPQPPGGWRLLWFADAVAAARAVDSSGGRLVLLAPQVAFGPMQDALPEGALGFAATPDAVSHLLRQMAASLWPLPELAAAYQRFLDHAVALADPALAARPDLALTARLLLVHWFRAVALQDPMLPPAALPQGWAGTSARSEFARLYLALSDAADSQIAAQLQGADGALPRQTPALQARYRALSGCHETETSRQIRELPKASHET